MAGFDLIQFQIQLDSVDAEDQVEKLGEKMLKADSAAQKVEKSTKGILERIKETALVVGVFGKLWEGVKTVIGEAAAILQKLSAVAAQAHTVFDKMGSAKIFGVTIQDAERLAGILNDVKSRGEGLKMALELKQLGLEQADMERFSHLINILAAVTGETKAALEARLKTGQITDRELGAMTKLTGQLKTQQGLQIEMLKEQAKAGGRALTQGEQLKTLIQFSGATSQLEASLGEIGKANPFDVLKKEAQSLKEEIFKDLIPAIRAIADALAYVGTIGVKALRGTWNFLKSIKTSTIDVVLAMNQYGKAAQAAAKSGFDTPNRLRSVLAHFRDEEKKDNEARLKAQQEAAKARLQATQEALQEQLSRMASARALLRNFEGAGLSLVGQSGSEAIGSTISGMSQAIELAKQFTALMGPNFEKKSAKAATLFRLAMDSGASKLRMFIQGEKQRTLSMKEQLTISEQLKAEMQIQREEIDTRRNLGEAEKAVVNAILVLQGKQGRVVEELRARLLKVGSVLREEATEQLRLLDIRRQLAAIEELRASTQRRIAFGKEEVQQAEDIRKSTAQLAELRGFIVRDRGEESVATAKQIRLQIQSLDVENQALESRKLRALSEQDKTRLTTEIGQNQKLIEFAKQKLALSLLDVEAKKNAARLADEQFALEQKRTAIQRETELKDIKTRLAAQAARISFQPEMPGSVAQAEAMRAQIQETQATADSLRRQMATLAPGSEKQKQMALEISHRTQILGLQQQELLNLEKLAQRDKDRMTVLGSFVGTLQDQALNIKQKFGTELANSVLGLAQAMTTSLGNLFSDLLTKPDEALANLGKSILSAFGDMAFKLAAFFTAEALGLLFTPGGQGLAAGLFAASAGMAAIGGLLKGASALVSVAKPAAASAGRSPTSSAKIPGQNPEKAKNVRETFILIGGTPWNRKSDAQEFNSAIDWFQRGGRATGKRLMIQER